MSVRQRQSQSFGDSRRCLSWPSTFRSASALSRLLQESGMEPSLDLSDLTYSPNKHSLTDSFAAALLTTDPASPFCDAVLVSSDGISIPACKALLAHRSEFFRSLFFSSFEEATSGRSELPITSATLRNVLCYAYCNEIPPVQNVLSRLSSIRTKASAHVTATEYQSLTSDLDNLISLAVAADYVHFPRLVQLCAESIKVIFNNVPATGCAVLCKCHEYSGNVLHHMDIGRLRRNMLANIPLYFDVPDNVLRSEPVKDVLQLDKSEAKTPDGKDGVKGGLEDRTVNDTVVEDEECPDTHKWRVLELCVDSLSALLEPGVPKQRKVVQSLLIGLHAWAKYGASEEPGRWKVAKKLAERVNLKLCEHTFLLGPGVGCGLLLPGKLNVAVRYHLSTTLKALQKREEELSITRENLDKKTEELKCSAARECVGMNTLTVVERNVEFESSVLSNLETYVTNSIQTICEKGTRHIKPIYSSGEQRLNPTWVLESLVGIEKNVSTVRKRHGMTKMSFRMSRSKKD